MKRTVEENPNKGEDVLSRRFFLSNALVAGVLMTKIARAQNLSAPKRSSAVTVENFRRRARARVECKWPGSSRQMRSGESSFPRILMR